MMAHWLDQEPGRLIFFSSSMHLYQQHFESAAQLLQQMGHAGEGRSHASTAPLAFNTPWESFPAELDEWMRIETGIRSGESLEALNCALTDPLLTAYARMIDLFWAFKRGADDADLERRLSGIGDSRLMIAAAEHLGRPYRLRH